MRVDPRQCRDCREWFDAAAGSHNCLTEDELKAMSEAVLRRGIDRSAGLERLYKLRIIIREEIAYIAAQTGEKTTAEPVDHNLEEERIAGDYDE